MKTIVGTLSNFGWEISFVSTSASSCNFLPSLLSIHLLTTDQSPPASSKHCENHIENKNHEKFHLHFFLLKFVFKSYKNAPKTVNKQDSEVVRDRERERDRNRRTSFPV